MNGGDTSSIAQKELFDQRSTRARLMQRGIVTYKTPEPRKGQGYRNEKAIVKQGRYLRARCIKMLGQGHIFARLCGICRLLRASP